MNVFVLLSLIYLVRIFMSIVAAYTFMAWGHDFDYVVLFGLCYFLLLMFANLEGTGNDMRLLVDFYKATLIILALSYVFLSLFGNMSEDLCRASKFFC